MKYSFIGSKLMSHVGPEQTGITKYTETLWSHLCNGGLNVIFEYDFMALTIKHDRRSVSFTRGCTRFFYVLSFAGSGYIPHYFKTKIIRIKYSNFPFSF